MLIFKVPQLQIDKIIPRIYFWYLHSILCSRQNLSIWLTEKGFVVYKISTMTSSLKPIFFNTSRSLFPKTELEKKDRQIHLD